MRKFSLMVVACLLLVNAQADDSADARAVLTRFIESADSYAANFRQQLLDAEGGELESSTGEFWLQRPGRFRWYYEAPLERILVSDGAFIWLYDVDLDQVTKRLADGELEKTPAGILVGDASALDNYELSVITEQGAYIEIGLKPLSPRSDFEDIVIGLDDGRLAELRLGDRFAQTTVISFVNARTNPAIESAKFELELPAYVDIIDQTAGQE